MSARRAILGCAGWPRPDAPFIFVAGIGAAVWTAKQEAGEKSVVIASPGIARQCLRAGLLDEIAVSLVPMLLGRGIPFFPQFDDGPVRLGGPRVVVGAGVTHLMFTVPEAS